MWDFLQLSDYFSALKSCLRKFPASQLRYELFGYDLTNLLKSISDDSDAFYYFLAHLYDKVVEGMRREGIKLHLFVDWFENQSFDKSFYWSMAKNYPKVPIHAYMGVMADTRVNPIFIATNAELHKTIAPQHIFVCNEAFKHQYEQSGYEGKVDIAPFYRSQKVWKFTREDRTGANEFNLFVPLGIFVEEIRFKTKMIIDIMRRIETERVHVFIKLHPASDESMVTSMLNGIKNIKIVRGDFYQHLAYADAVVASNSTTTYEAVASSIPVMYFVDPDNKFCLSKPDRVDESMWHVVDNAQKFMDAVDSISKMDFEKLTVMGNIIKTYYFEPVSIEKTKQLFLLD